MKKQNRRKYFIRCYAHWLKDGIYAVTNIDLEILMYTQIFILVKGTFFLKAIQQSSFIITKRTNKDSYFDAAVSI